MAYLPAAQRAFDVVSPVVIYRQIGRRPSDVYVDDTMTVGKAAAKHRLSDRVYWRTAARPGDQIQDRPGGVLLVTAEGECFPVTLAAPTPLTLTTAFTHADLAIKADLVEADRLIAAGSLVEAAPRRPKQGPWRPVDRSFAADHPLIVDALPKGVSLDAAAAANGRAPGNWTRRVRAPGR